MKHNLTSYIRREMKQISRCRMSHWAYNDKRKSNEFVVTRRVKFFAHGIGIRRRKQFIQCIVAAVSKYQLACGSAQIPPFIVYSWHETLVYVREEHASKEVQKAYTGVLENLA